MFDGRGPPTYKIQGELYHQIGPLCYVQAERSARLEWEGYDQVASLVVNGASASGTQ